MQINSVCGFLIVCLQGSPPATTTQEPQALDARLERVNEYLADERSGRRIPGMSAAVVKGDEVVWSRAYGLADVENEVRATPETVYRIASVSKMITAIAVLQLVQSGRLSLNAPLRDYVPELPDKGDSITVRHVLAHLSGIRHYRSTDEYLSTKRYRLLVDTLEFFKDDPLVAKPGERFVFSTWGYNLLGLVIERVGGMTFGDYVDKHVFEPLHMKSSDLDDPWAIVPHRARGYRLEKDGSLRNSSYVDLTVRLPGDGMISTAEDLARFAAAFMGDTVLDPSIVQVMTTEHKTSSGEPTGYGLGCFVRELDGLKIVGHAGSTPQASAFLLMIPSEKLAVVILANLEQADVMTMCFEVARILLGTR